MKQHTSLLNGRTWKGLLLGMAAGALGLAGNANAGTWSHSAWTNDTTAGITGVQSDYMAAINNGTGAGAVTVNGITFGAHATSGTNFSMAGTFTTHPGKAVNITGSSAALAPFLYNGNPRTVTLTNLTPGVPYEALFFAYGWEASGRVQTFASGTDSYVVDQDAYGDANGIRVAYKFVATATTRAITITPVPPSGTFHMSAFASRKFPAGTIAFFGENLTNSSAVINPVSANAATITYTVPFGTNLATLAPTFTLNSLTTTCSQTSGSVPTPDFSSGPVTYTVTDGATVNNYTVSVVVAPPSTARDITSFDPGFAGSTATITSTGPSTGTIEVFLPKGTPAAIAGTLAPTFTTSFGATCDRVNGTKPTPVLSIGGAPVIYTVTAQDGISTRQYSVTVQRSGWEFMAWTGDADSGIGGAQADYTVAANIGTGADPAVTVNGIAFQGHAITGTNYTLAPANADATGRSTLVTGDSKTLADNFLYNGNPRTITLTNLTPGIAYETSLFAYAWDALPVARTQVFAAGSDKLTANQNAYNLNNGVRFTYTFTASSATQVLTVTQVPGGAGTFHLSALANRTAPPVAGDSDADDLADTYEIDKAGSLTALTGLLLGPGPGAGTGDFDGDGLSDAEEYVRRAVYPALNPLAVDSDNDGLSDFAELYPTAPRAATNPTVADTDGDGLSDLIETNSGNFENAGAPGTSGASADSDGDHFPDGYEISAGGNPTSNTSYPTALPAGITLGVVTDEASTGISATEVYTHKISGGGAATINGVALDLLDTANTPANFDWNPNTGGKNHIGPAINNGTWVPATGNVTGAGNLQMFGTFTYSGGGPNPGNSQVYTLSALEPGMTYEMRLFIRKWDDGTVRPHFLKFTNGATVTNFYVLEDRPGIMLGNNNNESAYYISWTYVAESTTASFEATVSNVSSGNGSFHLYGLTNREASPPKPLDFVSIVRAPNGSSMTLTWDSRPGRVYKVEFSTDLVNWIELTDAEPSGGATTTFVDNVAAGLQRAQYRVTDVTAP